VPEGDRAAIRGRDRQLPFRPQPKRQDWRRRTKKTISARPFNGLVDLDVDYIIPMHCTGEPFYEMLKAEMPKKVIRSYTGTKLAFGADLR
jgi:hypothetical protein